MAWSPVCRKTLDTAISSTLFFSKEGEERITVDKSSAYSDKILLHSYIYMWEKNLHTSVTRVLTTKYPNLNHIKIKGFLGISVFVGLLGVSFS